MTSAAGVTPLLDLRRLTKRFGALVVTDDVSLTVLPGEMHALIGPNGAGKSCLIGQISGELVPDSGEVLFRGARVDDLSIQARARLGVARAYQVPRLFGSLSVEGNTAISEIVRSRSAFHLWAPAAGQRGLQMAAAAALAQVGLQGQGHRPSAELAHGEKRQLELAMGLAAAPSLLLLDEPLAGLGPGDSDAMVGLLRTFKGRYGILLVEHDVEAVFALADRVSVLVGGRLIASGAPEAIRGDPAVRAAYLGDDFG